jgi:hypothetical protein
MNKSKLLTFCSSLGEAIVVFLFAIVECRCRYIIFPHPVISLFEVAKLVRHRVEYSLNHNSLSTYQHHVKEDEDGTLVGGIDPLPASVGAPQSVAEVYLNSGIDLNNECEHGQDGLIAHVGIHLFGEHGFDDFKGLKLSFELTFPTDDCLNFGIFLPLKEVIVVVQISVVHGINDQQKLGKGQHWRIHLLTGAEGAEVINEAEAGYDNIPDVHSDEVRVGFLLDVLAFWGTEVAGQDVESQEIDVVGREDHDEESGDVFGANFEEEHTNEHANVD